MTTNLHTDIALGAPANASVINAPIGQLDSAIWAYGYNVKAAAFGAIGNGVADDTAAIAAAITAATTTGGTVFLPLGTYKVTSTLTIPSGVRLMGVYPQMGLLFGDTLQGSTLSFTAGAYDGITTPLASVAKGGGIENLNIVGFTDATHWLVNVSAFTGFTMRNVAFQQNATGANGLLVGGHGSAGQGVLQSIFDNISFNCSGGFTGGVGMQWGLNASGIITSACFANMIEIQGYVTGLNLDNGAGNQLNEVWVQSCTTGIKFGTVEAITVDGGWLESLTTGVVFGASAINNKVRGLRKIVTVTTLYTDAGTGNVVDIDGTYNGGGIGATAVMPEQVGGTGLTGAYLGVTSSKPMLQLELVGKANWEIAQDAGGQLTVNPYGAAVTAEFGTSSLQADQDLIIGNTARTLKGRVLTQQATAPTVGSPGAGVSAQSVIAGSTNTAGQVQATLTAVAPGVVVGVVAFNGGPLATAPKQVICSLGAPTAGVAAPPTIGADTFTTSGFTIRSYGPTTVTTGTYIINFWVVF